MNALSLFDGMACGYIAMQNAGVEIESYDAYEIDKYAIKTSTHNFPQIVERGDVFGAEFAQYEGVDFLIGGSPCTHWSIAQTKNRETAVRRDEKGQIMLHSSGIGFELFSEYLRALEEAKPKFFIYENNKSMSKEIRAAITECFGFEPVCINSALVSAQNRQRLYWVGIRNADGTYSKVHVEQPEDRGILLKDVLDGAPKKQHSYSRLQAAVPIIESANGKAFTLTSTYYKLCNSENDVQHNYERHQRSMVAEHVCTTVACGAARRGGRDRNQVWETRQDGKSNAVITGHQSRLVAEPVALSEREMEYMARKNVEMTCIFQTPRGYNRGGAKYGKAPTITTARYENNNHIVEPAYPTYDIYFDENGEPDKAIGKSGKAMTIYKVRDGKIAIKGKPYPVKLADGYYVIRKLTVAECKRLQTVPEWYEFPVSDSQAYKMLGNGWTCEVITHLIGSCLLQAAVGKTTKEDSI